MPSDEKITDSDDIEKLEEEISKRQKELGKSDPVHSEDQKDIELFFGDELAVKRKEEELRRRGEELIKNHEKLRKKEEELVGRERKVIEKEEYLTNKEKAVKDLEGILNAKQDEINKRDSDLKRKDLDLRKATEDFEKTKTGTELLKRELDEKQHLMRKSQELSDAEDKLQRTKEDLDVRETKISRMNDELEKKRKALQVVEEELVERKIKIEDEERKLKMMKEGLETKTREFESIFKEESDRLQSKVEEIERFMSGGAKLRPQITESEGARPMRSQVLREPLLSEPSESDDAALRREATERVQRRMAAAAKVEQTKPVETKPDMEEIVSKTVERASAPEEKIQEDFLRDDEPQLKIPETKPKPTAPVVVPEQTEEDILVEERARLTAIGSKPAGTKDASGKTSDDLLKLMQKDKKVDTKVASKILGVNEDIINKWAAELKSQGIITLHSKFMGGTDVEMTRDAVKRLKDMEEEEKVSKIKKELERIREEQKKLRGGSF